MSNGLHGSIQPILPLDIAKNQDKTRTNWPRKVRELILDSDPWSQGVKGGPTGSQGLRVSGFVTWLLVCD